jgi:formylglycine-generating enzyme required for sulfatase activity
MKFTMKLLALFFGVLMLVNVANAESSDPAMVPIPGKNYEMGKYEVTQKEWKAVMGNNPSYFSICGDNCPVEQVSWNDAQKFIQKLNAKTGKQYRLPTEAEWRYACYGGSKTEFCGADYHEPGAVAWNEPVAVAWYDKNSGSTTHPVGQKRANGYGLYDMSGNVWEWMQNCFDRSCDKHVLLGGSWNGGSSYLRNAPGFGDFTSNRWNDFGFRVARTLP